MASSSLEEFLQPLEVFQSRLAEASGVRPRRINQILRRERRIAADTAARVAYFGATSAPQTGSA